MIGRLFGWGSPTIVAKIHSVFETLESSALAIAVLLEVIIGFKKGSDAAWVILAIVDGVRRVYGWRDGKLAEIEKKELLNALSTYKTRQGQSDAVLVKLGRAQAERRNIFDSLGFAGRLDACAKGRAQVVFEFNNDESAEFAELINKSLVLAGWETDTPLALTPPPDGTPALLAIGARAEGITILVRSLPGSGDSPYVALRDAFKGVDFLVTPRVDSRAPSDAIWIVVGRKP
jgi:hypothetical protein